MRSAAREHVRPRRGDRARPGPGRPRDRAGCGRQRLHGRRGGHATGTRSAHPGRRRQRIAQGRRGIGARRRHRSIGPASGAVRNDSHTRLRRGQPLARTARRGSGIRPAKGRRPRGVCDSRSVPDQLVTPDRPLRRRPPRRRRRGRHRLRRDDNARRGRASRHRGDPRPDRLPVPTPRRRSRRHRRGLSRRADIARQGPDRCQQRGPRRRSSGGRRGRPLPTRPPAGYAPRAWNSATP